MSRIFITGSSDGLGSLAAKQLIAQGHKVTLHARNPQRAKDATAACPGAEGVVIADLSSLSETKNLAAELNTLGPFDAIVHNAGLYRGNSAPAKDGLPPLFAVNTLAPYVLTSLITPRPKRLVFVASSEHTYGKAKLGDVTNCNYGDSKLHNIMLAFAFARRWEGSGCVSNSVDPGWVPTKMGGASAPGDLQGGVDTYAMLATGEGAAKDKTGKYWFMRKEKKCIAEASDVDSQDKLLAVLEKISGVKAPE